jgi:hypothetical protein
VRQSVTRSAACAVVVSLSVSIAGCHRYETVHDPSLVVGTKGRLTLSPEGRANHARQLGGVATDVDGILVDATSDSLVMKAETVHFADLGDVPFAGGELRFAPRDISGLSRQRLNTRRTTVAMIVASVAALAAAALLSPITRANGGVNGGTNPPK